MRAKREPPETCAWCARPSNKAHRPNCPRPGEVFTATDLRNARAEATAAAEQRLRASLAAQVRALDYRMVEWHHSEGYSLQQVVSWVAVLRLLQTSLPTQASDSKETP